MHDIRIAFRQFRKSPGFALTVILTIALGIGANTAIFTLVYAVLMKSLPVVDPKTLYRVGDKDDCCVNGGFINEDGDFDLFSYELYRQFRDNTPEFEQLAAMQSGSGGMTVRRGSEPAKFERSEFVSGNYFSTFGIQPFAGRMLTPADDTAGAAPAVVLSYQAWQSEYGGDYGLVGSTLYVEGQPVTVAGIAPPGFFGDRIRGRPPEIWMPLAIEPVIEGSNALLHVLGQQLALRDWPGEAGSQRGSSPGQDVQQPAPVAGEPGSYTRNGGSTVIPRQHVVITPGGAGIQNLQQETGKGLYLLMAISALVLLVACANIANLLLARGTTRKAETSIRMALGAARGRLVRQMLTESVLLACLGGLAGLACGLCGNADDPVAGFSQLAAGADRGQPVAAGAGIRFPAVAGDRRRVRPGAGVDYLALRSGRSVARREPLHPRPLIAAPEIADRVAGRVVAGVAGQRRIADQEPAEPGTSGPWHPDQQPLRTAPGSSRRRLYGGEAAGALSEIGATVWRAPRSAGCGPRALQHAGGKQLG